MEMDVALDPMSVCLLRAAAIMAGAQGYTQLVKQFGLATVHENSYMLSWTAFFQHVGICCLQ